MKLFRNLALSGLGFGVLVAPAASQELRAASENVVACQDVVDALERLDCFEKAAAELSVALAAPTAAPAVVAAPTAPVPVNPADPVQQAVAETTPTAPMPAAPAETSATPVAIADAPAAPQEPVQQADASTTPDENVPRSSLPSWIPRITFGGDRDVEKEPDEYETTITRIQVNRLGRHFFTTAEGHVWKQKKIEEIRAPKSLPAEAILYQNITGGILIKIRETNRSYRVDRVE